MNVFCLYLLVVHTLESQLIYDIRSFNTRCKFTKMNRQRNYSASNNFRGLQDTLLLALHHQISRVYNWTALITFLKSFQSVCVVLYATTEADGVAKNARKHFALIKHVLPIFTHKWPLCQYGYTPVIS